MIWARPALVSASTGFQFMGGYDRWRIENIQRELAEIGCEVPLEPFGQGFKDMAPAVDKLERMVAETKLSHGRHTMARHYSRSANLASKNQGTMATLEKENKRRAEIVKPDRNQAKKDV